MKWLIDSAIEQVLETGINWISANAQVSEDAFESLKQKNIKVYLKDVEQSLYFIFDSHYINVQTTSEDKVDATITTTIGSALRDRLPEWLAEDVAQSVQIDGDIKMAQAFENYLGSIYVDWEEKAAEHMGDIPAHQFFRFLKTLRQQIEKSLNTVGLNAREFLQEEAGILPTTTEFNLMKDAIGELDKATDKIAQRVNRLKSRL